LKYFSPQTIIVVIAIPFLQIMGLQILH